MSYLSDPRYRIAIDAAKKRGVAPGDLIPKEIFLSAGFREEELEPYEGARERGKLRDHLLGFARAILTETPAALRQRAVEIFETPNLDPGVREAVEKTLRNRE